MFDHLTDGGKAVYKCAGCGKLIYPGDPVVRFQRPLDDRNLSIAPACSKPCAEKAVREALDGIERRIQFLQDWKTKLSEQLFFEDIARG